MANIISTVLDQMRAIFENLEFSYRIAPGVTVYPGGYYGLNAAGLLDNPSDIVGFKLLGVAMGGGEGAVDVSGAIPDGDGITGAASASPPNLLPPTMRIAIGGGEIADVPVAGLVGPADQGKPVFLTTSNILADLTLTPATNLPRIGYIDEVNDAGTLAKIRLDPADLIPQS